MGKGQAWDPEMGPTKSKVTLAVRKRTEVHGTVGLKFSFFRLSRGIAIIREEIVTVNE